MSLPPLTPENQTRYHRQMLLPEIGIAGQRKLKAASVLMVGAGGLGCPALTYLAAAGVGTIVIADGDLVDHSNLHRQPLYGVECVGRSKAEEALKQLKRINPEVNLRSYPTRIDCGSVISAIQEIDIVIDGSDNFATKYLLNDACVQLERPLVSGSVFCFEGQVCVCNALLSDGTRGPTYRCLFPEPPPVDLVPSCAEAGVLGVLPGIIGCIQANEAIKLILGIGELLTGRLFTIDALSMSVAELKFSRNNKIAAEARIKSAEYYRGLLPACNTVVSLITASELKSRMAKGEKIILIDVREPREKAEFDLGGILIPSATVRENIERIPRNGVVVVYCNSGGRSEKVVAELQREFGFTNLVSLSGGVLAW